SSVAGPGSKGRAVRTGRRQDLPPSDVLHAPRRSQPHVSAAMDITPQHLQYVLRLAAPAVMLGQRNAEWSGHGPILEEDIALSNMSLDLIGQARLLYTHAASLEQQLTGKSRTEDDYAYFRAEREFANYTLAELPHVGPLSATAQAEKDYAVTLGPNFLYSTLMAHLWTALTASTDEQLAAIASKSIKETSYHVHHAREWLIRFGDGTQESHRRAQDPLDYLVPQPPEALK